MLLRNKKRELSEEENNLRIALNIGNIGAEDKTVVHVLKIFKVVSEKGGDFNLRDAAAIEAQVKILYPEFPEIAKEETKEKEEKKEEEVNEETVKAGL